MVRSVAIETSEKSGSLALLEDDHLVASHQLDPQRRTTQTLAVVLRDALAAAAWPPTSIDLVAVTRGPGSFTGLRIAVTAAKTLAYASGAAIIGVNTLEVIAAAAPLESTPIWSVMDAQRGQVYAARFAQYGENNGLKQLNETAIWDVDAVFDRLVQDDYITGNGLAKVAAKIPAEAKVVDRELWSPSAACLARLAIHRFRAGQTGDIWTLRPQYYRKSAAEEKLEAEQQ